MSLQTLTRDQIAGYLGARLAEPLGLRGMERVAPCHPDRAMHARDMCMTCYQRDRRWRKRRGHGGTP